jgi:hypothetical protein
MTVMRQGSRKLYFPRTSNGNVGPGDICNLSQLAVNRILTSHY